MLQPIQVYLKASIVFNLILYVVDSDCCFTFSGSFSNCTPKGNGFIFPQFNAKIEFEQPLSLFMFNPTFLHCAEKGVFNEGEASHLFRNGSFIKFGKFCGSPGGWVGGRVGACNHWVWLWLANRAECGNFP